MQRRFDRRRRPRNAVRPLLYVLGGGAIALIAERLLGRRGSAEHRGMAERFRGDGAAHPESDREDAPLENSRIGETP